MLLMLLPGCQHLQQSCSTAMTSSLTLRHNNSHRHSRSGNGTSLQSASQRSNPCTVAQLKTPGPSMKRHRQSYDGGEDIYPSK